MLEHQLIQSTGFRNFGPVGAREGFAIRIRIPNYHGTRLSLLDGFDVTVDGEYFDHEINRFGIRNEVYTMAQMREETTARWSLLEWGEIVAFAALCSIIIALEKRWTAFHVKPDRL